MGNKYKLLQSNDVTLVLFYLSKTTSCNYIKFDTLMWKSHGFNLSNYYKIRKSFVGFIKEVPVEYKINLLSIPFLFSDSHKGF